MLSDALEIAGLGFLAVAAFTLSVTAGIVAVGVSCLLIGFALDRKGDA